MLKSCSYCGMTPESCESKQREAVRAAGFTWPDDFPFPDEVTRIIRRNECCANCQHIA